MAESKKSKDKQDRDYQDILLEKEPNEFTFQPNAHKYQGVMRRQLSPNT